MGGHSNQGCSFPEKLPAPPLILPTSNYYLDEDFIILKLNFPQDMDITQKPGIYQFQIRVNPSEFAVVDTVRWLTARQFEIQADAFDLVIWYVFVLVNNFPIPFKTAEDRSYDGLWEIKSSLLLP